jgi:Arc/MetJ-type ribon-helix-helix transcriptional regulator
MQIVLPPEVEVLVQRQLISGKYNSAIEVILAGVKLLEQQQHIYQTSSKLRITSPVDRDSIEPIAF